MKGISDNITEVKHLQAAWDKVRADIIAKFAGQAPEGASLRLPAGCIHMDVYHVDESGEGMWLTYCDRQVDMRDRLKMNEKMDDASTFRLRAPSLAKRNG